MKRQISISIFLAIFVIILTLLYIKLSNERKPEETREQNEQLVEEESESSIVLSQENITSPFYVKDEEGWLVVYHTKTQERYMDTGIETETLPEDLLKMLDGGIFFETEQELYDFLESYSS